MAPAGEHLEPDDLARCEVHLRLEEREKLAVLEAVANSLLDLALSEERALHACIEPYRPGGTAAASAVHGDIGAANEIGNAHVGRRRRCDSGEAAHLDDPPLEHDRTSHRAEHACGGVFRLLHIRGVELDCDCEFVAAQAADYGVGPELVRKRVGDGLEQAIAGLIAMLI